MVCRVDRGSNFWAVVRCFSKVMVWRKFRSLRAGTQYVRNGLSFNLISYAVIVVDSYSAAVRFGGTTCFAESGCRRWQPAVTQLLPIGQSFCRKGGCLNTHPNFLHRAPCRQSVIANGDVCVVSRNEWAFLRHICPVQGVFSRSIFSLIQLYISSSNLFCTATLIKFVWL